MGSSRAEFLEFGGAKHFSNYPSAVIEISRQLPTKMRQFLELFQFWQRGGANLLVKITVLVGAESFNLWAFFDIFCKISTPDAPYSKQSEISAIQRGTVKPCNLLISGPSKIVLQITKSTDCECYCMQ